MPDATRDRRHLRHEPDRGIAKFGGQAQLQRRLRRNPQPHGNVEKFSTDQVFGKPVAGWQFDPHGPQLHGPCAAQYRHLRVHGHGPAIRTRRKIACPGHPHPTDIGQTELAQLQVERVKPQAEIDTGLRKRHRFGIGTLRIQRDIGQLELRQQRLWKSADDVAQERLSLGLDRAPFAVDGHLIKADQPGLGVIIQIGPRRVKADWLRAEAGLQTPCPHFQRRSERAQSAVRFGFQSQCGRQRRVQHRQPAKHRALAGHIAGRNVDHGQRHFGGVTAARAFVAHRQLSHEIAAG